MLYYVIVYTFYMWLWGGQLSTCVNGRYIFTALLWIWWQWLLDSSGCITDSENEYCIGLGAFRA